MIGRLKRGFTLIELLIVVAIMAILAAIITANFMEAKAKARDVDRQTSLRELKDAIELYKNKYGRYPEACKGPTTGTGADSVVWSGQANSGFACSGGNSQYIKDLAPEFIATLPFDTKLNGSNSGYVYTVNSAGTVYKVKALNVVETETVDYKHPLKSCDIRVGTNPNGSLGSADFFTAGWCSEVQFNLADLSPACKAGDSKWDKSYGVWGGFEEEISAAPTAYAARFSKTTNIICR